MVKTFETLGEAQNYFEKNWPDYAKPEIDRISKADKGVHIATDLTIDAKWPGKLYGDFSVEPSSSGSTAFNYSATVPRLLKQYGKGEFGVSGGAKANKYKIERVGDADYRIFREDGEQILGSHNSRTEAQETLNKQNDRYEEPKQPVMWFTKETPTSFPIYEGVTGIFRMLQDQIAKEGGKASGVAKVALKYGVPAALLAKFLSSDDERRKKILKAYPKLGQPSS